MYIAKQKVKGKDYYYLRKSVREGKKVMSKNVAYLGKDKKEAELKSKEIIKEMKNEEQKLDLEKGVKISNEKRKANSGKICINSSSYPKEGHKGKSQIKEISIIDLGAGVNGFSYKYFEKNGD